MRLPEKVAKLWRMSSSRRRTKSVCSRYRVSTSKMPTKKTTITTTMTTMWSRRSDHFPTWVEMSGRSSLLNLNRQMLIQQLQKIQKPPKFNQVGHHRVHVHLISTKNNQAISAKKKMITKLPERISLMSILTTLSSAPSTHSQTRANLSKTSRITTTIMVVPAKVIAIVSLKPPARSKTAQQARTKRSQTRLPTTRARTSRGTIVSSSRSAGRVGATTWTCRMLLRRPTTRAH